MSRAFFLAVLAGSSLAGPVAAATVASFESYASVDFTLLSAAFVGAPGDATAYLSRSHDGDLEDTRWVDDNSTLYSLQSDAVNMIAFVYAEELEPVFADLSLNLNSGTRGNADRAGYVDLYDSYPYSEAYAYQHAYPAFRFDDAFCGASCDTVSSIELTFGYSLQASAMAKIDGTPAGATAQSDANAYIQFGISQENSWPNYYDRSLGESVRASAALSGGPGLFDAESHARSGTVSLRLRPGEKVYIFSVESAYGSANVAPVPVAPAMTLLPVGLMGFAFARWRQGSRERA